MLTKKTTEYHEPPVFMTVRDLSTTLRAPSNVEPSIPLRLDPE